MRLIQKEEYLLISAGEGPNDDIPIMIGGLLALSAAFPLAIALKHYGLPPALGLPQCRFNNILLPYMLMGPLAFIGYELGNVFNYMYSFAE